MQHLAGLGVEGIGVDLSPAMIEFARANVPDASFEVGSILNVPLPTASVEGVSCWYVLHHLPDGSIDTALSELVRLLVPGGVLLIGGYVGSTRSLKTHGYGGHPMCVQINCRTPALWENKLRSLGLIIETHTVHEPDQPPANHTLFARKPNATTH